MNRLDKLQKGIDCFTGDLSAGYDLRIRLQNHFRKLGTFVQFGPISFPAEDLHARGLRRAGLARRPYPFRGG